MICKSLCGALQVALSEGITECNGGTELVHPDEGSGIPLPRFKQYVNHFLEKWNKGLPGGEVPLPIVTAIVLPARGIVPLNTEPSAFRWRHLTSEKNSPPTTITLHSCANDYLPLKVTLIT